MPPRASWRSTRERPCRIVPGVSIRLGRRGKSVGLRLKSRFGGPHLNPSARRRKCDSSRLALSLAADEEDERARAQLADDFPETRGRTGMSRDETGGEGVQTRAIHAGKGENRTHAVTPPIWQTTTFSADSSEHFAEIATATRPAEFYTRYGNPTHKEVEATMVALEGVEAALVDQTRTDAFAEAVRPNTRVLYAETPTNPLMRITDLRAVAELARERGVTTIVDNTFATPVNQRPLEFGCDE